MYNFGHLLDRPQEAERDSWIETIGLACLLEALNEPCFCESESFSAKAEEAYECLRGPVYRWWRV